MKPKSDPPINAAFQTPRHIPLLASLALTLTPAAWAATETFTTPGTINWDCPPGVTSVTVETRGGGGAAGSVEAGSGISNGATQIRGGGGAGGSYAQDVVTVSPGTTYKIKVGAGGLPVTTIPGGTPPTTGEAIQIGGASAFSSFDELTQTETELVKAVGGVGGANFTKNSGSTSVSLNGGIGDSTGSIGAVIFAGGSGANGGNNYGGGGGAGAGSAAAGAGATGLTAGVGAGGGGSGGNGRGVANGTTNPGVAPGGGGGSTYVVKTNTRFGGAGARGQVKLTYTFASGLDDFDIVASSPQTAGVAFDVTITAQDASNMTIDDSSSVVTVTSPAGSLMEFDWDSDGNYGDNSGTLVNGVKTIKARNKKAETKTIVASYYGVSTNTPPSVQTTAAAFARLQILAPGETTAPATVTGKTGTPSPQFVGVPFNATVNAVDEFWNFVSGVTDTVGITSSDGTATLPLDAPLVGSTRTFAVALNTLGPFTITATDLTPDNGTQSPDTSSSITAISSQLTWDAGNTANGGSIDPADGTWNTTAGNIVWNDTLNNIVWDPTRQAVFGGSDGTYAVTVGGSFSAQKILFSSSGYTLSAASAQTITITSPGSGSTQPGLAVASGKTATIGTNVSVNGNFTYYVGAPLPNAAGGTLNVEGKVNPASSNHSLSLDGVGTIINVKTGGTLGTLSGNSNADVTVAGSSTSGDVTLNVEGGTVTVGGTNTAAQFNVGGSGKGTVTLTSGAINVAGTNAVSTNGVTLGDGASNDKTNTFNLDGGILTTRLVRKGAGTGSTAVFNFNGGTLKANTDTTAFMTGLDQANVESGGALINTVAFNVTIGQNLLDGTGGGGLTKLGSGTLTLTGNNTYTGPTAVNSGNLLVNGDHSAATGAVSVTGTTPTLGGVGTIGGAVTLGAAGGLSPGSAAGVVGTLTINNALDIAAMADGGTGKLAFQLGPIAASDTIAVTGALTIGPAGPAPGVLGFSDFTFTGIAGLEDGTYPLITGASSLIGGLDASNLTGNIGTATGTLQITGNNVELVVINDPYIAWAGAGVLFDADANNDGVDNGLAWLLGAANPNDNATGKLPVITQTGGNLKMTFDMLPIAARGTAQLFLEHSANLGTWSTGVLVPDANGGTAPVTFIVNDSDLLNPNNPLDVEATVSSSEAAAGKLFGRLKAVK